MQTGKKLCSFKVFYGGASQFILNWCRSFEWQRINGQCNGVPRRHRGNTCWFDHLQTVSLYHWAVSTFRSQWSIIYHYKPSALLAHCLLHLLERIAFTSATVGMCFLQGHSKIPCKTCPFGSIPCMPEDVKGRSRLRVNKRRKIPPGRPERE